MEDDDGDFFLEIRPPCIPLGNRELRRLISFLLFPLLDDAMLMCDDFDCFCFVL